MDFGTKWTPGTCSKQRAFNLSRKVTFAFFFMAPVEVRTLASSGSSNLGTGMHTPFPQYDCIPPLRAFYKWTSSADFIAVSYFMTWSCSVMAKYTGHVLGVREAFLKEDLAENETLFMQVPHGMEMWYGTKVYLQLCRTLDGLKQAAYRFWIYLLTIVHCLQCGLQCTRSKADPCLDFKCALLLPSCATSVEGLSSRYALAAAQYVSYLCQCVTMPKSAAHENGQSMIHSCFTPETKLTLYEDNCKKISPTRIRLKKRAMRKRYVPCSYRAPP